MADPLAAPDFAADVAQVSKYLMGRTPSIVPEVPGQPVQLQWNAVNRRWARKGTVPFDGDYIDIATQVLLAAGPDGESPASQLDAEQRAGPTTPTILMAWTDNRDMRDVPPSQLNPDGSVPFVGACSTSRCLGSNCGTGPSIVDPTPEPPDVRSRAQVVQDRNDESERLRGARRGGLRGQLAERQ